MAAVAGVASVASAGLGLMSSVMGGEGQQAADQMQAEQLSEQAQAGQAAAVETNANLTQRLNQSLGNIDAVRAARGDSMASPEAQALRDTTIANANEAKAIRIGNILSQSEMDTASSNYLNSAGSYALTQSVIGGLAGAAGTIAKTNPGTFGLGASVPIGAV